MANLTAYAKGDGRGSITWSIYLTKPRVKEDGRWRRYRGVRSSGRKNESLSSVLMRTFAMHKASMLVCGRVVTLIKHAVFFDAHGRMFKPPPFVSYKDLCINK